MYAQFQETLGGLQTIRAYGDRTRFLSSHLRNNSYNLSAWYALKVWHG